MTTTVIQGDPVTLSSSWFSYEGGPAADLDATPTIGIVNIATSAVAVSTTTTGVTHPGTGTYSYTWDTAPLQAVGDYLATWSGTASSTPVTATETITVTANPAGDMLATVGDLESALGLSSIDSARAQLLIECATAAVQAMAGGQRILQVVDDAITIMGTTDSWLALPQIPVTAVSLVVRDGVTLTLGTDYKIFGDRLWSRAGWQSNLGWYGGFPADQVWRPSFGDTWMGQEPGTISVTYTHGYAAGSQELQLARSAVVSLAAGVYSNPSGAVSESIDDYSVSYARASSAITAAASEAKHLQAAIRRQYGRRATLARAG